MEAAYFRWRWTHQGYYLHAPVLQRGNAATGIRGQLRADSEVLRAVGFQTSTEVLFACSDETHFNATR